MPSLRYYGKLSRGGEMDKKMFHELLESVKEMDAIASGKKKAIQSRFQNSQLVTLFRTLRILIDANHSH